MAEPFRVALYYAPERDDPLWRAGCAWLGRDPESGAALPQPQVPALPANTAAPRRYGFHATLKAPFTPRFGFENFLQAAINFAAAQKPFGLPRLQVTPLHGFLALCPAEPSPALQALADGCVTALDDHRQPEDPEAQARRALGRPPRQAANIARWGYPLVFEEFRFHLTLTGKMQSNPYAAAAGRHFAGPLAHPRQVRGLAVFTEAEPGAPFRLARRLPFGA